MLDSHVFLFGANPMQPSAQEEFIPAAGDSGARLVRLLARRGRISFIARSRSAIRGFNSSSLTFPKLAYIIII